MKTRSEKDDQEEDLTGQDNEAFSCFSCGALRWTSQHRPIPPLQALPFATRAELHPPPIFPLGLVGPGGPFATRFGSKSEGKGGLAVFGL